MPKIKVQIITPEKVVYKAEAESISMPSETGEITVLPHHIPLITVLKAGELVIREKGKEDIMAVSRGIAEINGKEVNILVDTADRAEEMEEEKVQKAREEAKKVLEEKRFTEEEYAVVLARFEKEAARLKVIKKFKTRKGIRFNSNQHE